MHTSIRFLVPLLATLCACRSTGPPVFPPRILRLPQAEEVSLDQAAEFLSHVDVVFLGEDHDNDAAHALQLTFLRALKNRRGELTVSLEMFERDVQETLDAYLGGELDEEAFLEASRPWKNYAEHYRPIVEWARENGYPVLAANAPKALASKTAKEGLDAVSEDPHLPTAIDVEAGAYRDRFEDAMGGHDGFEAAKLDRYFAAQVLRDESMADAIAESLESSPGRLVVHLCGKFHSDHRLGTVERLLARVPGITVGVVTTEATETPSEPLDEERLAAADLVWVVPVTP